MRFRRPLKRNEKGMTSMNNPVSAVRATPAVMRLIGACRNLGLVIRGARTAPDGLTVEGDRSDFPHRLWDVAAALRDISDSYETDYLMPRAMAEAMIERARDAGIDTRPFEAISDYFLDGKVPTVDRASVMKLILEKQRIVRDLGGVAPPSLVIGRMSRPSPAPSR